MLKTTQSGYEGYLRDQYTLLPETKERMMASSVTASWKCASVCLLLLFVERFVLLLKPVMTAYTQLMEH